MWARGAEEALDGRMMVDDAPLPPKDAIKKWCALREREKRRGRGREGEMERREKEGVRGKRREERGDRGKRREKMRRMVRVHCLIAMCVCVCAFVCVCARVRALCVLCTP
jgi:hypothetical protein